MYRVMAIANYETGSSSDQPTASTRERLQRPRRLRLLLRQRLQRGGHRDQPVRQREAAAPSRSRPRCDDEPLHRPARPETHTLRALARLLRYPDAELRALAPALADALREEAALAPARLAEIDALVARLLHPDTAAHRGRLRRTVRPRPAARPAPVRARAGDSRDRGRPWSTAADLRAHRPGHGARRTADHLPVVLEFASTSRRRRPASSCARRPHRARDLSALLERSSAYAAVTAAVLDLAGEPAQRVELAAEPPLDDSWAELRPSAAATAAASRGRTSRSRSTSSVPPRRRRAPRLMRSHA